MIATIEELIRRMGPIMHHWHPGARPGNYGEAGNTLEDLLGIPENNFTLPDFGKFEIKSQKFEGHTNFLTLFHKEPKPRATVPKLLKRMGWRHKKAGTRYPIYEMSFHSTTYGHRFSDRGFTVKVDQDKYTFVYDTSQVDRIKRDSTGVFATYGDWAEDIEHRSPHYRELFPIYYSVPDLVKVFQKKLDHTMYVIRKTRYVNGFPEYSYEEAYLMEKVRIELIGPLIKEGVLVIDFDASTHKNHGTKFRIKKSAAHKLFTYYRPIEELP